MNHDFNTTLPISPNDISRYDIFAGNKEKLTGITNPLQSPLHPEALSLENIKPGMNIEIRNQNRDIFVSATVHSFPFRQDNLPGNPFVVRLRNRLPNGGFSDCTCLLSAIGVVPDKDDNIWSANHYALRASS